MPLPSPPNAADVRKVVEERLNALESMKGAQETVTVEWRGQAKYIPVISMPLDLLHYNPDTHRIRAQRSIDPAREQELETNPFGALAQSFLHQLLMGDPADPSKVDPSFVTLKDDLREHGQAEPGIITRSGVLINGNTRQAALKELGLKNIRVGVLPPDAGYDDLQSIELSLQLRRDHKREYSFVNFLLAIDERTVAGQLPADIQSDFRIKAGTYERSRWILAFIRDAIDRSRFDTSDGRKLSLRLIDFESHQGKLEELYRAFTALKAKSPDEAEKLREQRLLGIVLNKSKTDLRLIEPDFVDRYMKGAVDLKSPAPAEPVRIPGPTINVPGPGPDVQNLRQLTTEILRARAMAASQEPAEKIQEANALITKVDESVVRR